MKNENIIPAVDKALKMIGYLAEEARPAVQTELCKAADVTATTGYRIVQTLIRHDWVRKTQDGRYTLSLGMLDIWLKSSGLSFFFEQFQPILENLAKKTRLSCKLSIRSGNNQISVLRAESPDPFSISGKIRAKFPVVEGSVGAALLCKEPEDEIRALCAGCREDIEEKNKPELVLSRISEWKKKGFTFSAGKSRWHIEAMSVPVIWKNHASAALTLLGNTEDFKKENMKKLCEALAEAKKQIESQI